MTHASAESRGAPVTIDGLSIAFEGPPRVEALAEVSFDVPAGGFTALLGPSGCGKSTLLKALAGLIAPDQGTLTVANEDVAGRPGAAAYMPQGSTLLPWRRVLANATLGAEIAGIPAEEAADRARQLLPRFGLGGFEQSWPAQLSGGMQQRLALLRTFLTPKPVLLLDEPFGALDAITRRELHAWLQEVWGEDGRTVLLVTHDVEEALTLADPILVFSPRPGRIVSTTTVDLPRPRSHLAVSNPRFIELKSAMLKALDDAAAADRA